MDLLQTSQQYTRSAKHLAIITSAQDESWPWKTISRTHIEWKGIEKAVQHTQ